jgi:hypothetical protein
MAIDAPSLDDAIRWKGLTYASFRGLTIAQSIEKMQLDDKSIRWFGEDHKARCRSVKNELVHYLSGDAEPATSQRQVERAPILTQAERDWTALAIIEAGEWRRAGCPPLREPADPMARKIIAAAAKARGEGPDGLPGLPELPRDPTARAIVLAGKRRRGEIE